MDIKNNLNIWEYTEYEPWYRIDKKIILFFKKIKWMWQRSKYGYCDKDLWSLDYTLGNYIASSVNELANRTHGYPFELTAEEWDSILRSIARSFYLGTNEECWSNPYEEQIIFGKHFDVLSDTEKECWKKWFEVEKEKDRSMTIRRQEGFNELSKWFSHLWD